MAAPVLAVGDGALGILVRGPRGVPPSLQRPKSIGPREPEPSTGAGGCRQPGGARQSFWWRLWCVEGAETPLHKERQRLDRLSGRRRGVGQRPPRVARGSDPAWY